MVDGRTQIAPVVVVDFDGTLIRGNSFRLYVRLGMRHASPVGKVGLVWAWALRRCGLIGHAAFRRRCAAAIGLPDALLAEMRAACDAMRSPAVARFLAERKAEGCTVLLATAAMEEYVGAVYADGPYIASAPCCDCRGERKLQAVLGRLDGRTPAWVLSDNEADLPLLRHAATHGGRAVLVNPSAATLRFFRELEPAQLFDVELLLDGGEAR